MNVVNAQPSAWLLLVTNLPGQNQTLRMRIWRALKASGAGLLRDGVYVLPQSADAARVFAQQALEIRGAGGSAYVLPLGTDSDEQRVTFRALFDRTVEYTAALKRLEVFKRGLVKLNEADARRQLAALSRELDALISTDFFPGESCTQIQAAQAAAELSLNAQFAPDEPQPAHRKIRKLDLKDYRGGTWATREHLWIDRVCSAWLIQRFIDPKAKFLWLKQPKKLPKRAVGFDFDGAEFTHVDSRITFEVLLLSFDLERDSGLSRLAALVHYLDIGGIPVPESAGFAAVMSGARLLNNSDDALLKAISPVLDCLYATYGTPE